MECTAGYQVLDGLASLINSTCHFLENWLGSYCIFHLDANTIHDKHILIQLQLIQYHCMEYNHRIHIAHQRHKWRVYKYHWPYDNFHIDSRIDLFYIQYLLEFKNDRVFWNNRGRPWAGTTLKSIFKPRLKCSRVSDFRVIGRFPWEFLNYSERWHGKTEVIWYISFFVDESTLTSAGDTFTMWSQQIIE